MESDSKLSLESICAVLGLQPQFLLELASTSSSQYETFDRKKKSGGFRTISVPKNPLKRTQRLLLDGFLSNFQMPPHVHGCVRGRSILTNAQVHVNKPLVINIDLTNFFGTIDLDMVNTIFREKFNCDDEAAKILSALTVYGNFLPQGAPTSPVLSNIAAFKLDESIIETCSTNRGEVQFHYTRYVDDITISGDRELYLLVPEIYKAIEACGFRANPKKLRVARPSTRQKVTGVIVNERVNAPKKLLRRLRQQLYYCKRFGFKDHCKHEGLEPTDVYQKMNGAIGYIRITRPDKAFDYRILLDELARPEVMPSHSARERKLNLLKDIIEREGSCKFKYENQHYQVAPSEVTVNTQGSTVLRGFQIQPLRGWRTFLVRDILNLREDFSLS